MKRSEINKYIVEAKALFSDYKFELPPWAFFSPDDWNTKNTDYLEVKENMLGWDVTDFGLDDYEHTGLLLFTIRNGNYRKPLYPKVYAEKIMVVRPMQITPIHFHWSKMEDIINRGGGTLCLQVWKADEKELLSDCAFTIQTDGCTRHVRGGDIVRLNPGESITFEPRVYHKFWAEGAITVVGEVSQVNDDNTDNRFYEPLGRFPAIVEDEPPVHLLCNEYPELHK